MTSRSAFASISMLVMLPISGSLSSNACAEASPSPLKVKLECVEKKIYLAMEVTNLNDRYVDVPSYGMPWSMHSPAMKYQVFRYVDNRVEEVPESLDLSDDFMELPIKVEPHGVATGRVSISYKFGLNTVLQSSDVFVVFSYNYALYFGPFNSTDVRDSEGGVIFLPKRGWFGRDCGVAFVVNER